MHSQDVLTEEIRLLKCSDQAKTEEISSLTEEISLSKNSDRKKTEEISLLKGSDQAKTEEISLLKEQTSSLKVNGKEVNVAFKRMVK